MTIEELLCMMPEFAEFTDRKSPAYKAAGKTIKAAMQLLTPLSKAALVDHGDHIRDGKMPGDYRAVQAIRVLQAFQFEMSDVGQVIRDSLGLGKLTMHTWIPEQPRPVNRN